MIIRLSYILSYIYKKKWTFLLIVFIFTCIAVILNIFAKHAYKSDSNLCLEFVYNIFFPVYPLSGMIFPLRSVMMFLWENFPQCLYFLKYFVFMLPAALAMSFAVSISSSPWIAGALSFILSLLVMSNSFEFILEQILISSTILMSVASFYSFRDKPKIRIVAVSAALCTCMHSKGICFPFCLIVFAVLFYDVFKSGKNRILLSICFSVFLFGGISWSIIASAQNRTPVLFTETGRRLIPNLVAGAMGLIQTTEGDIAIAFDLKDRSFYQALTYATEIVMHHPFVYLESIAKRTIWLSKNVNSFLLLFILFICSLFCRKIVKKAPLLFFAAAYFFGIYIIMPVETRYFIPALYLFIICSSVYLSDSLPALRLKQKAIILMSKNNYGDDVHSGMEYFLSKQFPGYFISTVCFFLFSVWGVSIWLLNTFQSRYVSFDADRYIDKHPDNTFLLIYPLRKGFPNINNYEGLLSLYEKTENPCTLSGKRRWLKFYEGENVIDKITCSGTTLWQEILLDAFKDLEQGGDDDKAINQVQTALLSCMLVRGYVRNFGGKEHKDRTMDISDRLVMSTAEECSEMYKEFVFALPENHKALKHKILNSMAFDMLFPDKIRDMFKERNSDTCTSCCVSHGQHLPPSNCGIITKKGLFISNFDYLMPVYYLWRDQNFDSVYKIISSVSDKNKRLSIIDSYIRSLQQYVSIFDDEIVEKARESEEMRSIFQIRNIKNAAYTIVNLYYIKGDNAMAGKYLAYAFKNSIESNVRSELYNPKLLMNLNMVYSKINRINSEKERINHINYIIGFWESYMKFHNENTDSIAYKMLLPDISYNLAKLYILKGDNTNARKYLIETIKYSDGLSVSPELSRENIMKQYISLG